MSTELKQAVQERVALGYSKEQIVQELHNAGYDDHTIEVLYINATAQHEPTNATTNNEIPATITLFESAFVKAIKKPEFIVLLAIPTLFFSTLELVSQLLNSITPAAPLLMFSLMIGMAVLMYLLQFAVMRVAIMDVQSAVQPSLPQSLVWAMHNFWPWVWVSLLTFLVVLGGMFLLIIPGVIVGVYIAFAQYTFIDEGVRGMAALERSRQLVYGRWWTVFRKFFLLIVFFLIFSLLSSLVIFLCKAVLPMGSGAVEIILNALFSGFVVMLAIFSFVELYSALRSTQKHNPEPTDMYPIFAVLGAIFSVLLIGILSVAVAESLRDAGILDSSEVPQDTVNSEPELSPEQAEAQAELEALRQRIQEELHLQ